MPAPRRSLFRPSEPGQPPPLAPRVLAGAVAALIFGGVGLWCMSSVLGRWTTAYVGAGELEGWIWRYWWMKQLVADAWTQGTAEYAIYVALVSGSYPETGNIFDLQWFSVPLELLFGAPSYYNFKVLLFLVLNGLSAYWLARLLVEDWSASVLCGLAFGFGSYILLELDGGRIRHAAIFPLALYAFCLVKLFDREAALRWLVLAGLSFGLCTSTYMYYGMSAAFLTVLWLVAVAAPSRPPAGRKALRYPALVLGGGLLFLLAMGVGAPPRLVQGTFALICAALVLYLCHRDGGLRFQQFLIVGMVAFLFSVPYATWYIRQAATQKPLPEVVWHREFPPLDFLLHPQNVHATDDNLLNSLVRFRNDSASWDYPFQPGYRRSVPLVFTLLAAAGLLFFRRRPWLWISVAALGYLLALGPYLRTGTSEEYVFSLGGISFPQGIPLLQTLFFKYVPFFSRLFSPIRMQGLFLLGFSVVVAWSTASLFRRLDARPAARVVFTCLVACLALFQMRYVHQVPLVITEVRAPDVYPWIAAQDASGVVELPLKEGDFVNYYQIFHGRRVLEGWAAGSIPEGFPAGRTRWLADTSGIDMRNGFLQYLRRLNEGDEGRAGSYADGDLRVIRAAGYRHAILHERGCLVVKGPDGHAHYLWMRSVLERLFGPPVKTSQEFVRERPTDQRAPVEDGLYAYDVAVFDLGPPEATSSPASPAPSRR